MTISVKEGSANRWSSMRPPTSTDSRSARFQIHMLLLCAAVLFIDAGSTHYAIGYVAPAPAQEW